MPDRPGERLDAVRLRELIEKPIERRIQFFGSIVVAIGNLTPNFRHPIDADFSTAGSRRSSVEPIDAGSRLAEI